MTMHTQSESIILYIWLLCQQVTGLVHHAGTQHILVLSDEQYAVTDSPIPGDIPGDSPFEHCNGNRSSDLLEVNRVTFDPKEPHQ